jgi:hypothetical protein
MTRSHVVQKPLSPLTQSVSWQTLGKMMPSACQFKILGCFASAGAFQRPCLSFRENDFWMWGAAIGAGVVGAVIVAIFVYRHSDGMDELRRFIVGSLLGLVSGCVLASAIRSFWPRPTNDNLADRFKVYLRFVATAWESSHDPLEQAYAPVVRRTVDRNALRILSAEEEGLVTAHLQSDSQHKVEMDPQTGFPQFEFDIQTDLLQDLLTAACAPGKESETADVLLRSLLIKEIGGMEAIRDYPDFDAVRHRSVAVIDERLREFPPHKLDSLSQTDVIRDHKLVTAIKIFTATTTRIEAIGYHKQYKYLTGRTVASEVNALKSSASFSELTTKYLTGEADSLQGIGTDPKDQEASLARSHLLRIFPGQARGDWLYIHPESGLKAGRGTADERLIFALALLAETPNPIVGTLPKNVLRVPIDQETKLPSRDFMSYLESPDYHSPSVQELDGMLSIPHDSDPKYAGLVTGSLEERLKNYLAIVEKEWEASDDPNEIRSARALKGLLKGRAGRIVAMDPNRRNFMFMAATIETIPQTNEYKTEPLTHLPLFVLSYHPQLISELLEHIAKNPRVRSIADAATKGIVLQAIGCVLFASEYPQTGPSIRYVSSLYHRKMEKDYGLPPRSSAGRGSQGVDIPLNKLTRDEDMKEIVRMLSAYFAMGPSFGAKSMDLYFKRHHIAARMLPEMIENGEFSDSSAWAWCWWAHQMGRTDPESPDASREYTMAEVSRILDILSTEQNSSVLEMTVFKLAEVLEAKKPENERFQYVLERKYFAPTMAELIARFGPPLRNVSP